MGNISSKRKSIERIRKHNSRGLSLDKTSSTREADKPMKPSLNPKNPTSHSNSNSEKVAALKVSMSSATEKVLPHSKSCIDVVVSRAVQRPSSKESIPQRPFPIWFPFKSTFQRNLLFGKEDGESEVPVPEPAWASEYDPLSIDNLQFMSTAPGVMTHDTEFTSFFQNPIGELDNHSDDGELDENIPPEGPMVSNPSSGSVSSKESKKNGSMLPIKMSRGGHRGNSHRRGIHKKQRAAHQASSPPSQASGSFSDNLVQCHTRELSPPPTVRTILGKRVTMVDEELKVFVVDLLSPETCELVRSMTDAHVRQVNDNGNLVATWRTLYTYTKQDLPVCEVKNLKTLVTEGIMTSISAIVGEIFQNAKEAEKLRPRSWKGKTHLKMI
jgi:hypothetical protein